MPRIRQLLSFIALVCCVPASAQQNPAGLVLPGTAAVADRETLLMPGSDQLGGLLGARFTVSERSRLLHVDEDELLSGFRHKPGKQAWIGEHVGKWLHAASLAYANTHDPALKAKLDRVVRELLKTQEPDGYLGTYTPETRFGTYPNADWDVWVHKYCILGLLAYYQVTHDRQALEGARRAADLVVSTFGPGKKSILTAGQHMGMAATSILEPMVLLYRATKDPKYLAFGRYIVSQWETPQGPHILSALEKYHSVRRVANGKAYEMLSNLCGLVELYRATGEKRYLDAVLIAWDDIVRHRLYLTGSGSSYEVWQEDNHLPNGEGSNICETCVTVTWEQLNIQLLRLLGETRFADQIERSVYNHLLGAQKPTGEAWAYYTPLAGRKPYSPETTCCLSSGPRGVALLPSIVYAVSVQGPVVNLYTDSRARIPLARGGEVDISQRTQYPLDSRVQMTVNPVGAPKRFALQLRVPAYSRGMDVRVNGKPVARAGSAKTWNPNATTQAGYVALARMWKPGDRVDCRISMPTRLIVGDHENQGKAAVLWGPVVLAVDEGHNRGLGPIQRLALATDSPGSLKITRDRGGSIAGEPVFVTDAIVVGPVPKKHVALRLCPYYTAGQDRSAFAVWINRPGTVQRGESLFYLGNESRSREGNQQGSICDGDPGTFAVTFDGTKQEEAWFAVTLPQPVQINRIVFTQGQMFHDGGWYDTSAGKPRIQIQRAKDGAWEDAAPLDTYPETSATQPGTGIADGRKFSVRIPAAAAYGIRTIGKPACGDNPAQAFASCGELEAFLDR